MQLNELDTKDTEIIDLLKMNARLTWSEIGEKVGLSRTAVKNRVTALEKAGIIKGYRAVIDPLAHPEMIPFVINIETKPEHFEEARAYFANAEETVTLVQTTGHCHLLAICVAPDILSMRNRITNVYRALPGIVSVNSHSILEVIKGRVIPE